MSSSKNVIVFSGNDICESNFKKQSELFEAIQTQLTSCIGQSQEVKSSWTKGVNQGSTKEGGPSL
jgi:hypothetical protein